MFNLQKSLEDVFTANELMSTAREAGFCKRTSKIKPSVFFDLMMYDVSSGRTKSLNQLAIEAMSEHDIGVTKQGIDKKFNDQTLTFLKLLIEKQLSMELDQQIEAGWLSPFNRVTIKDGTRFNLPEKYKFMSRFNLFITNVPKETLPDEVVSVLYRMRWQIELIFYVKQKIMQSNLQKPSWISSTIN